MKIKRLLLLTAASGLAGGMAMLAITEPAMSQAASAVVNPPAPVAAPAAVAAAAPATGVAPAGSTTTGVTVPNSSENYLDDRLSWPYAVEAWANLTDTAPVYCIPAHTKVIGAKATLDTQSTTTPNSSDAKHPIAQASQYQEVYLDTNQRYFDLFGPPQDAVTGTAPNRTMQTLSTDNQKQVCPHVTAPAVLVEGAIALVPSDDLTKGLDRSGWDYGALLVPFKLQLSKGNDWTGSASIGPYAGYRFSIGDTGLDLSIVGFAGASTIAASTTNSSGQTNSQNLAALSYGGGLIWTIKQSNFQIGMIYGYDHVGSSETYQYNNKPWISLEIGYSFAQ